MARRGATQCDASRCIMLQRVSPDRYSRRARITRATQLVTPKYRAPKDVTYDTAQPARTVHIFVGDEQLIVDLPPRHIRSGEGSRLAYQSNVWWKSLPRVTSPYGRRYKYMMSLEFLLDTWLITWFSDRIVVAWATPAFNEREIFYRRIFLSIYITFKHECLNCNQTNIGSFDIRYLFLNLLYLKFLPYFFATTKYTKANVKPAPKTHLYTFALIKSNFIR